MVGRNKFSLSCNVHLDVGKKVRTKYVIRIDENSQINDVVPIYEIPETIEEDVISDPVDETLDDIEPMESTREKKTGSRSSQYILLIAVVAIIVVFISMTYFYYRRKVRRINNQ